MCKSNFAYDKQYCRENNIRSDNKKEECCYVELSNQSQKKEMCITIESKYMKYIKEYKKHLLEQYPSYGSCSIDCSAKNINIIILIPLLYLILILF